MIAPLFLPPPPTPPEFVLDVHVPAAWLLVRRATLYTDQVQWRMASAVVVVPSNWTADLCGHLLAAERRGETTQPRLSRFLALLGSCHIFVDDETPFRVFDDILTLARTHNLPVADAAYLELALRLKLPIATADPALTRAATSAGAPTFTP
jgi:predicted nucleic acid-binding protein